MLRFLSPSRFPRPPIIDECNTMSAIVIKSHGTVDVLEYEEKWSCPKPYNDSSQVVIDIIAAGVNPVDVKMRKNIISNIVYPKPKIIGSDFSGIVINAPKTGAFKVGDKVYGMLPLLGSPFGSYCGRCCIDPEILAKAPTTITMIEAASLPLVSCTVIQALKPVIEQYNGNCKGKKVFISCGSGGVGVIAIQYCAKVLQMNVTTTASTRNFDLIYSLGASTCIDYHTNKIEETIKDFDVFFDTMGYNNEKLVLNTNYSILRNDIVTHYIRIASSPYNSNEKDFLHLAIPEARLDRVATGFMKQFYHNIFSKIKYHFVFVVPNKSHLEEMTNHVNNGLVKCVIQEKMKLVDARRAHTILEDGHVTGKLVLVVNDRIDS